MLNVIFWNSTYGLDFQNAVLANAHTHSCISKSVISFGQTSSKLGENLAVHVGGTYIYIRYVLDIFAGMKLLVL